MIVGIGTDLCVIERFEAMLRRRPGIADCTAIFTVSATFWWSITYTAASC